MTADERARAAVAAIAEQLSDLDGIEGGTGPTEARFKRWVRMTSEVLANKVGAEEARAFRDEGRLRRMPRYDEAPEYPGPRYRRFLEDLKADIEHAPVKFFTSE